MRHVRQELGLVFRGECQFGGFFLEGVASLLDLGVLPLDLGVLLGEKPRLGSQFFVGLLKFALARLQLDGELLRLRQQPLRSHRCLDSVKDRTDALGELIEEGEVNLRERLQRREFDDGLGLALEEHRQHDDAHLPGIAETRRDGDEIGRDVREQNPLLLYRALPGKSLAKLDGFLQPFAPVSIAFESSLSCVSSSLPPK